MKIKKGDKVVVLTGKSRFDNDNSKGREVLQVLPKKNKVIVAGVNIVKKHTKPNAENPQGGIQEFEAPIHVSNVALIDENGKPTRVGYKIDNGKKIRIAKSTGNPL